MCQSPRSFPCQPPCLHLRPPAGASLRTPGRCGRLCSHSALPSLPAGAWRQTPGLLPRATRGLWARTLSSVTSLDTWGCCSRCSGPQPPRASALQGPAVLVLPRGLLGCARPLPSPAGPSAPSPFTGGSAPSVPGVSSDGVCARLLASRLQRPLRRPHTPAASVVLPSLAPHTRFLCLSCQKPPRGSPLLCSPPPHHSLPAAAPARGIRLSMVAGDRCLPSPGCSPSTGRPPGAKPPTPRPPGASAAPPGLLFALTTSVISRAGGSAGRLAPPSRFPLHPGQAGLGAAPKRAVKVPSAPAAPLWTNH